MSIGFNYNFFDLPAPWTSLKWENIWVFNLQKDATQLVGAGDAKENDFHFHWVRACPTGNTNSKSQ